MQIATETKAPLAVVGKYPVGIFENVPNDVYHQREYGVASKSALDLVRRTPATYEAWVRGELARKETAAFTIGSAFHAELLEPGELQKRFAVEPHFGDCRKPANKIAKAEWYASLGGRVLLSEKEFASIQGMVRAVRKHPIASQLVSDGVAEVTARWVDEATGVRCKCRPDYYVKNLGMALDVKSTEDASEREFAKSIGRYAYHRQAGFYTTGLRALGVPVDHFVFMAVEKEPPHGIALWEIDEWSIREGAESTRVDLETLAECLKTGVFPSYPEEIRMIQVPAWAT